MVERTAIINASGDYEETIVQFAKHLGTSRIRRRVFNAIYGRGTKVRSKKQIMAVAKIANSGTNSQQVQNELDHLAKHHLIVRMDNAGAVKDGSRNVYRKDATVRANRERILRLADNRRAAERVPTKRRPIVQNVSTIRTITKRILRTRKHLTVLYLTASPESASPLRVDAEVRKVQEAIRGSRFRDNVTIEYRPAANLDSLIDGLNDCRPQIVQFSGHGNKRGIATDDGRLKRPRAKLLSFDLLSKALSATDSPVRVVILNSCESSSAKRALLSRAKSVTEIVIAMRISVTDVAAAAFATRFYAAVASGQSIKAAFDQGKIAVEAVSIREGETPELLCRADINPAKVTLT